MAAETTQPLLVQAVYSFKGKNNDELCFKKGDIITVTQKEEGGWWEGTFGDITGWFPSNYVKEYCTQNSLSPVTATPLDLTAQQKVYRSVVLKDLIDSERAHVTELQGLVKNFLRPLETSDIIKPSEYQQLIGNLPEVIEVHEQLLAALEDIASKPAGEQRVGHLFLTTAPRLKQAHLTYCASHPRAVCILDRYKQELGALMEANGAASPGLLVLTTGLSKPFRRLDKYAGMLTEMERHVEEAHIDRGDTQRSVSVYKDIASACCVMRRQKEMELEVVNGGVRGWEGEDLAHLGDILHMGSVAVGPDHRDRYFVLFPSTLLMLSVSQRMSAFIYEGKLPLTGISINKLEDSENFKNAFEITGPMIERIVAICQTKEDQQAWVDMIRQQIRNVRVSSPPPIVRPTPPPHNSVSHKGTPYSRLAAYFARLVRKGIITRKLLKRLLYSEFNSVKTDLVRRRRRNRKSHRVECYIYPQEPVHTWISETESSDDESSNSESESQSGGAFSCEQSEASSCLGYVKGAYRSTLTISRPAASACPDISRMDSTTTITPYPRLSNHPRSHYLSLPVLPKSTFTIPTHSSCLEIPSKAVIVNEIVKEDSIEEESVGPLHRSYSYHFVQDNSYQCSSSHRSTDSGLADILASPDLTTPALDNSLPAESEGSGNYEAQCVCSSPFGSTPRTSPQPTSSSSTPTYRSAMYAHWCLKMRIPASSVKRQPPDADRK